MPEHSVRAHLAGLASWGVKRVPLPAGAVGATVGDPPEVRPTEVNTIEAELAECEQEVSACEKCRLHETRNRTVFGVGNPRARLMFVGEAPGAEEDRRGEPFVGAAGQLLNKIIEALGLTRQDVYIANVLKCRPPGNRDPESTEIALCSDYLARQVVAINPEIIVALGRPASHFLLGTERSLGELRKGTGHRFKGIPVVVTYHPAYLLRNPDQKRATWADLQRVVKELKLGADSSRA